MVYRSIYFQDCNPFKIQQLELLHVLRYWSYDPNPKKKSSTGFLSVTIQFIKLFHWSTKLSMEQCFAASVTCCISDLLNYRTSERTLRSSFQHLLATPKARLKTCGERTFPVAGPGLWNSIPLELRSSSSIDIFKGHFKTCLFKQASNSF